MLEGGERAYSTRLVLWALEPFMCAHGVRARLSLPPAQRLRGCSEREKGGAGGGAKLQLDVGARDLLRPAAVALRGRRGRCGVTRAARRGRSRWGTPGRAAARRHKSCPASSFPAGHSGQQQRGAPAGSARARALWGQEAGQTRFRPRREAASPCEEVSAREEESEAASSEFSVTSGAVPTLATSTATSLPRPSGAPLSTRGLRLRRVPLPFWPLICASPSHRVRHL